VKISHENAQDLEKLVTAAWGVPDASYLGGLADAGHFESHPYDAIRMVVAPFVHSHHGVHGDGRVSSACQDLNFIQNDRIEDGDGSRTSLTGSEEMKLVQTVQNLYGYLKDHY